MQSLNDIWELAVSELAKKYEKYTVDLWLSSLVLCDLNDSTAVFICDPGLRYKIVTQKYLEDITEVLAKVIGFRVEVVVINKEDNPAEYLMYVPKGETAPEPVNLADFPPSKPAEDENSDGRQERPRAAQNCQNEYTFENFVVGNSNKFAHAACVAVSNDPACSSNIESTTYNPLFIYGPSGVGKTHLLYAIINQIRNNRPKLKIVYVKGEEFTNQLIDSISKKTPEKFREKYRTADILLIDDIQFIAGRDSTQEEFFHTFNALYEDHRQIILTSDRPPKDIQTLEDRLKTRFEWGITADIQPPDADLRAAILKKKAGEMNIQLSNDVVNFLAENLKSNIRQLEGAIKKLGAMSLLTGVPITIEVAKASLSDLITGGEPVSVTVDRILDRVAKKYGVLVEDMKGTKRTKEIAYARHVSIYLIRRLTDRSLPQIGKIFNRDHTTIISSLKTIEKELGSNPLTEIEVNDLEKEIKG
ncbi:MAG: chromosomal replication initiator protein DnaA [Clostridiales bacterium]|nr:chromosomal replication initiator protein DnaA [Clostridiales bacterium]